MKAEQYVTVMKVMTHRGGYDQEVGLVKSHADLLVTILILSSVSRTSPKAD